MGKKDTDQKKARIDAERWNKERAKALESEFDRRVEVFIIVDEASRGSFIPPDTLREQK